MKIPTRAIILGEFTPVTNVLKQFLFNLGMRETLVTKNVEEIKLSILNKTWPLVFISDFDEKTDGLNIFDTIYRMRGYELIHFIFFASETNTKYHEYGLSVGASGVIARPINQASAMNLMKKFQFKDPSPALQLALHVTDQMLKGQFTSANTILQMLTNDPMFQFGAEIAIARSEVAEGDYAKAELRLKNVFKKGHGKIRIFCEIAEICRIRSQYSETLKLFQRIRMTHPQMTLKIWDEILMLLELDDIDQAAMLLEKMADDEFSRDNALEGLGRIMIFMGLQDQLSALFRASPRLAKIFHNHVKVT